MTVTSLKPAMPPCRPATFFNVQVTSRSAPGADCCAAWIAASSAFWRFPAFDVPWNVLSVVAMLVLALGVIDTHATAWRWRGIHDAQIAITRGVTFTSTRVEHSEPVRFVASSTVRVSTKLTTFSSALSDGAK